MEYELALKSEDYCDILEDDGQVEEDLNAIERILEEEGFDE